MGILSTINGLNGGRGFKALTDHGSQERDRLVRHEKKVRGLCVNADVRKCTWYKAIENDLFLPENEGSLWVYVQVTR